MIDAFNLRDAWGDAGRDHNVVKPRVLQHLNGGRCVQSNVHACIRKPISEIAQHLVELSLARHCLGKIHLATKRWLRFDQGDLVTSRGGLRRACHSCCSPAHDRDAAQRGGRLHNQVKLTPGKWIHHAGGGSFGKNMIQAGLVAADARVDSI